MLYVLVSLNWSWISTIHNVSAQVEEWYLMQKTVLIFPWKIQHQKSKRLLNHWGSNYDNVVVIDDTGGCHKDIPPQCHWRQSCVMTTLVFRCQSLQWRHNGRDGVSNHQPHDCLLNLLFRRRSKKSSKLRVTGLSVGHSPVTGEFPAQWASNAENVSIWWRHHVKSPFPLSRLPGRDTSRGATFQHGYLTSVLTSHALSVNSRRVRNGGWKTLHQHVSLPSASQACGGGMWCNGDVHDVTLAVII